MQSLCVAVSVLAIGATTGALAQTAPDASTSELPPLEVETTPKKPAVKKKPTSEPQAPVTQETSASVDPEAPVVFSANRTPTDAAKVGSSVSVITEKDIEAQSKTFLQDYLKQVPGVSLVQQGSYGGQSTLRIRGFNQNYIKVLVDGMDLSDPSGVTIATQFENLLVGDMAQVEVLRGSQSTLYGADSIAGVISIDTKYAAKPGLFHSGAAEYGTYNTWRGAYTAGYGGLDGSNIAFTIQGLDTDGFSAQYPGTEDDGYRNVTFSGRGEYKLSDTVTVFFAGRAMDADLEYDGLGPNDATSYTLTEQLAGRVGTTVTLLNGQFINTLAIQGMDVSREYSFGWYEGDRVKAEYRGVLSFNEHLAVVAGADWEHLGANASGYADRKTVEISSPYAQLIVEPLDGLILSGGARIDNHSTFGSYDTHRLTAAYLLPGTATKFHASYGTGFRAPSLDELYGPFGSNPNLTPETSTSWDAGVEQTFMSGMFGLGATYFEIAMKDKIGPDVNWDLQQLPGITETSGIELTGFARLSKTAVVNAAYTYQDSEEPDGSRVIRLPRHSLVLALNAQPIDKVSLNVTGQYIADSLDGSAKLPVDDYFLLSAKVGYEIMPGTVAYVRGDNLLDQDYVASFNYNTPGLTVFGGVQFALPPH